MMTDLFERIAVMSYPYCHYTFEYFLKAMERFGVRKIDIWAGSPHLYYEDMGPRELQRMKEGIASHGLSVVAYTPEQVLYPYNLAAREDGLRARSIEYFKTNIRIAAQLGAPLLLVSAGWGYLDERREEALDRSRQSLRELAAYAHDHGVILALEALTKISSNLINYADELARMVADVSSPALAGMLDLGQMGILGETVEDYFKALGCPPIHMHIMDGRPAGHLAFGDGILPVYHYLREALRLGYAGCFTMEMNDRQYYLEPDKAIARSLEILKGWMAG
jgi:protein FrlC